MKFPITKAEFLAWCRENPDEKVTTWDTDRCLIARAAGGYPVLAWADWAEAIANSFDGLDPQAAIKNMRVRTAMKRLAARGVPGFTKKELREAAGL